MSSTDDVAERLKKRFASGWSDDKVVELARAEHSADAVAEDWRHSFEVSARGFDDDFIGIAACILWERLLPRWPSFEMLDDGMQAGYAALKANDVTRISSRTSGLSRGRPSGPRSASASRVARPADASG